MGCACAACLVQSVPSAARRYLDLVGLSHAGNRMPGELSGGMRQRVQIARVLVNEPSVVLMDEPFGALDAQTREVMQVEVDRIWRATRPTILFITHDIWEAILLGDRIITMTAGPDATFKTVATVEIPHPRELTAPAALKLYSYLREDIASEVRRTLQAQGLLKSEGSSGMTTLDTEFRPTLRPLRRPGRQRPFSTQGWRGCSPGSSRWRSALPSGRC